MKTQKDQRWVFHADIDAQTCAEGVERRVLAYCKEMMCVENHFETGAIGALHSHPHTQITYIISGKFEFCIDGIKKIVSAGDTMLKQNEVVHGCVCLEKGLMIDVFTPMREDFVGDEK